MSIAIESSWSGRNDTALSTLTIPNVTVVGGSAFMTVKAAIRTTTSGILSIAWGSATFLQNAFVNVGTVARACLWYSTNVTPGTNNLVVTFAGTTKSVVGATVRTGVDLIAPFVGGATATGTSLAPGGSVGYTGFEDHVVLDVVAMQASITLTPSIRQTQTLNDETTGVPAPAGNIHGAASWLAAIPNPQPMSWTASGANPWAWIGAALKARQKVASFNLLCQSTANLTRANVGDLELYSRMRAAEAELQRLRWRLRD